MKREEIKANSSPLPAIHYRNSLLESSAAQIHIERGKEGSTDVHENQLQARYQEHNKKPVGQRSEGMAK